MSHKRPASALEGLPARPPRKELKRIRLSPSSSDAKGRHGQGSDSSGTSSGVISEDEAMRSTPPLSSEERRGSGDGSVSSLLTENEDEEEEDEGDEDGSESSLSTSSDEEAADSDECEDGARGDEGEEIITLGGPKKPRIRGVGGEGAQELRGRLAALLPRLAEANAALEEGGAGVEERNMEVVGEGERCIEFELGLGVLEEKGEGGSEGDEDERGDEEGRAEEGDGGDGETRVMERLLGREVVGRKGGIEEVV
ncbi:hypothetical protein B0A50_03672 [Salinomyces thailandicus]|uniref:Uncharacterized protein n=1 Tax=Salinomyces thailandicus TaxID=706561 RepID=A0A4U0U3R1_9PEZI|nr:hypothetical protein B0A50_03672 [Salinomyces thailandica]